MSRPGETMVWVRLRDSFRTRLWPLPSVAVALAVVLGVVLPRLEATHTEIVPAGLRGYLFTGGADAARTVLDAVAGSLITVTSLTFSLTVVTLQLASSQFSPRLLRTFTRDLTVQATLGLFLGTFAYALTVLRTVRTESDSRAEFVPDLSVTVAFGLAIVSVVGLIFFLAHLAQTIRVESMLNGVADDAADTVDRELAEADGAPLTLESLIPAGTSTVITATSSGFLVRVHEQALLAAVVRADAVVVLDVTPGDWLVAGTPVGAVWAMQDGAQPPDDTSDIEDCLVTGFERTAVQDVALGLRQLTDVAVKALSPGINDPTTAVHALGHSSALLGRMVRHDLGPRILHDDQERMRVGLARPDLGALVHLAVDQPARYGAGEPAVLDRLFMLLAELAWVGAPHHRVPIRRELERLRRLVERQSFDGEDDSRLAESAARVDGALVGRWDVGSRSSW